MSVQLQQRQQHPLGRDRNDDDIEEENNNNMTLVLKSDGAESLVSDNKNNTSNSNGADQLNLHPATNEMMKRVSSCYFSIASNDDDDELEDDTEKEGDVREAEENDKEEEVALVDVLYHDMMMHIFSYLDFKSLACFSETSLCPNFECFYYLQLQLQQHLYSAAGNRQLNRDAAQQIFQTYLNSNSTLKESTMPLSHSILQRLFFATTTMNHDPANKATALLMMIGAAAAAATTSSHPPSSYQVEAAAKLGLAAAGCGAVKAVVTKQHQHHQEQEQNDHDDAMGITARLYNAFASVYGHHHFSSIQNDASTSNHSDPKTTHHRGQRVRQNVEEKQESLHNPHILSIDDDDLDPSFVQYAMNHPITPNPYDHPEPLLFYGQTSQSHADKNSSQCGEYQTIVSGNHHSSSSSSSLPQSSISKKPNIDNSNNETSSSEKVWKRKKPSGCVGAYLRALQSAKEQWILQIKSQRLAKYEQFSDDEKFRTSTAFIDACASDQTLFRVKELVPMIDVDAFHVGSDGTEACALHTAAFNGATQVVDYLCTGASDSDNIGGLCNVNLRDDNGWTALHFAAGTNAVEIVQLLAKHGAKLSLEADNGYTPYHWAQRLSSHEVVHALEELGAGNRFLINNDNNFHSQHHHARFFGSFVATRMLSFLSNNLHRNHQNNNNINDHDPAPPDNDNNNNVLDDPNIVIEEE